MQTHYQITEELQETAEAKIVAPECFCQGPTSEALTSVIVAPECSCQGPTSEALLSSVGSCLEQALLLDEMRFTLITSGQAGTTNQFGFETASSLSGVRNYNLYQCSFTQFRINIKLTAQKFNPFLNSLQPKAVSFRLQSMAPHIKSFSVV